MNILVHQCSYKTSSFAALFRRQELFDFLRRKMCQFAAKKTETTNGSVVAKTERSVHKAVLNLDRGDPTMYVPFWENLECKETLTIPVDQGLSYFSAMDLCWFMEPELKEAIKRLHSVVGNAETEDKFIVVGTGSTQLINAAMYALSDPSADWPVNVVSLVPYYSGYPEIASFLRSSMYKWEGDAALYDKDEPYIEMICTPNNPDGSIQGPVVPHNVSKKGKLVHDFAYLWPQYTPIETPADNDIMLFTLSKCTGHAGSRIGWALVKDKSVALRMVNFIVLSTIGVSKESQLRTAKIMGIIADGCGQEDNFFEYGKLQMKDRWSRLRKVIDQSDIFTVKDYKPSHCNFFKDIITPTPAYAWMSSEYISDLSKFFEGHRIIVRGGAAFGAERKYVRVSMLGRAEEFNQFLERLASFNMADIPVPDDRFKGA